MKDLFAGKGIKNSNLLSLSAKETVDACAEGAIVVDVREEYLNSYKMFGVTEVIYLPMTNFSADYRILPEDRFLIIADSAGLKSKEATIFLMEKGYNKVANLAGGLGT